MIEHSFEAVAPQKGASLATGVCVSSYSAAPNSLFSPFTYSTHFNIPVPGQDNMFSRSVEGIWQGLKIINGETCLSLFSKKPKKRRGIVEGHLFGKEVLDLLPARQQIYRPSYFHYVEHYVSKELKEQMLQRGLEESVSFFDVEANVNPQDPSAPLAHSAFLAEFFQGYLTLRLDEVKTKIETVYLSQVQLHETVAEPVSRAKKWYLHSSPTDKLLIKRSLQGAQTDEAYKNRFFRKLAHEIKSL